MIISDFSFIIFNLVLQKIYKISSDDTISSDVSDIEKERVFVRSRYGCVILNGNTRILANEIVVRTQFLFFKINF